MGIRKALVFSFACHLFGFSFFTFSFDINPRYLSEEKPSIAFLGSLLQKSDFSSCQRRPIILANNLSYAKIRISKRDLVTVKDKPLTALDKVSFPKHLNKFLVFERKIPASEKQKAQERYLTSTPAWDKVNLKLKIE